MATRELKRQKAYRYERTDIGTPQFIVYMT